MYTYIYIYIYSNKCNNAASSVRLGAQAGRAVLEVVQRAVRGAHEQVQVPVPFIIFDYCFHPFVSYLIVFIVVIICELASVVAAAVVAAVVISLVCRVTWGACPNRPGGAWR